MDKDYWYYAKQKEIQFQVKGKKLQKAFYYREYILVHLRNNLKISPAIFEKFLSFFDEVSAVGAREVDFQKIRATHDFFMEENLRGKYDIKGSIKVENPFWKLGEGNQYSNLEYSLWDLIVKVFIVVNRITDVKPDDTGEFVRRCYLVIEEYLENHFTESKHKTFSRYKRTALAAFICSQCGWKFPREIKEKNPPQVPDDWHDIAKAHILLLTPKQIRFHPDSKKSKSRKR